LLVWLQPRRDSTPAISALAGHLQQGGRALVAVQHYNVQQRQYRGAGFQTVYWPQPQFPDLAPYLALLGVQQPAEVLFDRTRAHLVLDTQVNRSAVRAYTPQQVALPFLIRSVGTGLSPSHPVVRNLGALLFAWGNRWTVDPPRLAALGLAADTLASTSSQAWSYAWSGGWIPPEVLAGGAALPGPQPLALVVSGSFPGAEYRPAASGEGRWVATPPLPSPAAAGTLVLVGCATMFENPYLEAPGFDHDQFLLNAVCWLTHGPQMTSLLNRQPVPAGIPHLSEAAKRWWRVWAVGGGPALLILLGLVRWLARRRVGA